MWGVCAEGHEVQAVWESSPMTIEMCPRCGGKVFHTMVLYTRPEGEFEDEVSHEHTCAECLLTYFEESEMWKTKEGAEWLMAESGT